MEIYLTVLIIMIMILLGSSIYIYYRNYWVYRERCKITYLNNDFISYDKMMLKFWIWDIEKLKKE